MKFNKEKVFAVLKKKTTIAAISAVVIAICGLNVEVDQVVLIVDSILAILI